VEVGLALCRLRPVVVAVDQGDRYRDVWVEGSGGDHALDVSEDRAGNARVSPSTTDASELGQVVIRELGGVVEAASQNDSQHRPVLHARDGCAEDWEACAGDVRGGDAIGPADGFRVVVDAPTVSSGPLKARSS